MKPFTPNSRVYRIRHCKQFAPFKKYVVAPRQIATLMQVYSIQNLSWFYPLNAQDTADTLNKMRSRIDEGSLFYTPFKKKDTGIYAFLIGSGAPFVLLFPGGGYGDVCSLVEGYSTALKLNAAGYNVFIVNYTVGKMKSPTEPAEDVASALSYIFAHCSEWNVGIDYAVCGFSAGGHLAATWGTKTLDYQKYGLKKPEAVILCYPVITVGEFTHVGSRKNLLGAHAQDKETQDAYSIEKQVEEEYPPTFIWQCKNDSVVPFQNSLLMKESLQKHGVPYELMAVEGTVHGWGAGVGTPAEGWIEKAVQFWKQNRKTEEDKTRF